MRHASNNITRLKNRDFYLEKISDFEDHIVTYYKNLFNSKANFTSTNLVDKSIHSLITQANNDHLTLKLTQEEIKDTILNMDGNSVLGLINMEVIFFEIFWDIVGHNVVNSLSQVLS